MESVDQAGGDPAAVNFSEMPFQHMEAQLERGNTDAIWTPEPFLSRALANEDNQLVGYSFQDAIPGMPTMVTFTSGTFAQENPDEAKAMLTEFINLPEEAAKNLRMEELSGEIRKEQIEQSGRLMVKFGFISKDPDFSKVYWEGQ